MNLFKKIACFSDIHFGLKNNSKQHNEDCENFIKWFIVEAKKRECETFMFLGDWHNSRDNINVSTLNYTIRNVELLSKSFETVYMITGNHDLYYRDKRDINSIEFNRNLKNVIIVSDILIKDNCSIIPWLVEDEWTKIKKIKSKYMFGHFELPAFKMNAMIDMPDTGELHVNDLYNQDIVFSGHFHKRQQTRNVIYIGNTFPHNFSDVDDNNRGAMFLEWDKKTEFASWPEAPRYQKVTLTTLLNNPDLILVKHSYTRVDIDINITYEYTVYIKELLSQEYDIRELTFLPFNNIDEQVNLSEISTFESVDKVVLEHIETVESNIIDNELLAAIYLEL